VAACGTRKTTKENETKIPAEFQVENRVSKQNGKHKRNKGLKFYLLGSRVQLPNGGTSSNPSKALKREKKEVE